MRRSAKFFAAFCSLLIFSAPAFAAEAIPGGACSDVDQYTHSGGPESGATGYDLACDGSNWKSIVEYDVTSGRVNIDIGNDTGTCTALKLGRLRYNGTSTWEYCNGSVWTALSGIAGNPAGSSGQVQFNNAGVFGASANLFWDNTNARLGIGNTAPATLLDLKAGANIPFVGQLRLAATDYDQVTFYNAGALTPNGTNRLGDIYYDIAGTALAIDNQSGNKYILLNSGGGNVGIGTSAPAAKLAVNGGVNIGGTSDPGAGNLAVTGKGTFGQSSASSFPLYVHASTNNNLRVEGPVLLGTGMTIGPINDAASANMPLEFRTSYTAFTTGGVNIGGTNDPGVGSLLLTTPDEGGLSIRQSNATTYGFDFALDQGVDGALHINRVVAGTPTNMITFSRATGGVNIGGTSDPGLGNLNVTGTVTASNLSGTNTGDWWSLPDFTTWDAAKVGPVSWYNLSGGPSGSTFYTGYRARLLDPGYGNEIAIPHSADRFFYRRYANGYGSWQELANLSGAIFTGNIQLSNDRTTGALYLGTFGHYIGRNSADGALYIGGGQAQISLLNGVNVGGTSNPGAGNLSVTNHIGSTGTAPTSSNAGYFNFSPLCSIGSGSTDLAGTVTVSGSGNWTTDARACTVLFAQAFASAPTVVISARNNWGAFAQLYVSSIGTGGFDVNGHTGGSAPGNVIFSYIVMGK
jgi:hypothetical protein